MSPIEAHSGAVMANPRPEDGHVDLAHKIVQALSRQVLSRDEWRILMVLFRKTYGWHKKEDWISMSQSSEMSVIARHHVPRILKKLARRNLIVRGVTNLGNPVTQSGNRLEITYQFQKDFEKWRVLPKQVTLLPDQGTTKEIRSLQKKLVSTTLSDEKTSLPKKPSKNLRKKDPAETRLVLVFFGEKFKEIFEKELVIDWGKGAKIVKKLLRVIPFEELKDLIEAFFVSGDPFIRRSGYTIGVFKSQVNKLRIQNKQPMDGMDLWLESKEVQRRNESGGPKEIQFADAATPGNVSNLP